MFSRLFVRPWFSTIPTLWGTSGPVRHCEQQRAVCASCSATSNNDQQWNGWMSRTHYSHRCAHWAGGRRRLFSPLCTFGKRSREECYHRCTHGVGSREV